MAYASLSHVQARCPRRSFTASSIPNTAQVQIFLDERAAELDGMLVAEGFQLPIATTATIAWHAMQRANAIGAWYDVEKAAPEAKQADAAAKEWKCAQEQLLAQVQQLDAPRDPAEIYARSEVMFSPIRQGASGAFSVPTAYGL